MTNFSKFLTAKKETTVFILTSQNDKSFDENSLFPEKLKDLEFYIKNFYSINDFKKYIAKHRHKIVSKYGKLFFIIHENKKFSAYDNECNFIKEIETKKNNKITFIKCKNNKKPFLGFFKQKQICNYLSFGMEDNTIEYVFADFKLKKERLITPKKITIIALVVVFIVIPTIIFIYLQTKSKANTFNENLFDIIVIFTISITGTIFGLYNLISETKKHFIAFYDKWIIINTPKIGFLFLKYQLIDQINFYDKKIVLTYHAEKESSNIKIHQKIVWHDKFYDTKGIEKHLRRHTKFNTLITEK